MNTENLLRAMRNVYLLVPKPSISAPGDKFYWTMGLDGLSDQHIKKSVISLRQARETGNTPVSKIKALKITSLQNALATTLGARSYDQWREAELCKILAFLEDNGMTRPADLINWSCRPGFADALTAQRLAERFFNSGLSLPKRLFTGVGSMLFAAKGYGRLDIDELAGKAMYYDEQRLEFCAQHENDIVLRAHELRVEGPSAPEFLDLTARMLFLNAVSEYVGQMYNLLADNLSAPLRQAPVITCYNTSAEENDLNFKIFQMFRREIEKSVEGWVEVVPMPGNDSIVFLKGASGTFDWVVRDQRDRPFTANPYYPILKSDELPSAALQSSKLAARLYFKKGEWRERLQHLAETRHYAEGGSVANWPGYDKLILRELVADAGYVPPRSLNGPQHNTFVPHRLKDRCLMVSPLVTVEEFWQFYKDSEWRRIRVERLAKAGRNIEEDLGVVNLHDAVLAPASVTWFDAIAYCRYFENKTGLPVRLLEVEEWREISPPPARDIVADGWGDLTWVVKGGDGRTGTDSAHRYPEMTPEGGSLHFGKDLTWSSNHEGLPFLSAVDFGEWLGDYRSGYAAAANAATGRALMTGPLERDTCPAHLTMRYKGLKVGFRLCYVARPDA
jgi:hypothetical protein